MSSCAFPTCRNKAATNKHPDGITFHRSTKTAMKLVERELIINAQWGKIAALTWGNSSDPPVLLCHGKMDVSTTFRPLVSLLPECFYYVSVDLPGNGRSDPFPKGGRFTVVDFVPTIAKIKEHFKWEKFSYIGHSLGALIGIYYDLAYPGCISRMVELDPMPAVEIWEPVGFANWYHLFYGGFYDDDKYEKVTASVDTAPIYSYEKALDMVMDTRGLTSEAAKQVLERSLAPAGDGVYRFTFDQRLREVPRMPISCEFMEKLYTLTPTPILAILAQNMVKLGAYKPVPFMRNTKAWPNKNYMVKFAAGGHDFHLISPESIAGDIAKFLMEDVKAKL